MDFLDDAWNLFPGGPPPEIPSIRGGRYDGSAFAVQELATTSTALMAAAAAELAVARGLTLDAIPETLHHEHAIAAFSGHLSVNGSTLPVWADLSGVYPGADGRFIQLHCNFPHHAAGVVEHLGVAPERQRVAAAIAQRNVFDLETELVAKGLIAAACRTLDEWETHSHALATNHLPLLSIEQIGPAAPRELLDHDGGPANGVRVLDCSRVLAGPVCGQTLAGAGADVLRIGAAHLPSVEMGVIGTGFGKRNAFIDLTQREGKRTMDTLASTANVMVDAYRPGSLAAHGYSPERLASLGPGIVVIQLCAFDWEGPWAGRRGFDSIVQSTTGISMAGASACGSESPVSLPFQALDYATGFLAAFASLRMLAHQLQVGGSWLVRLSLLRTRNWLVSMGGPTSFQRSPLPDLSSWTHHVDSTFGSVEAPRPIVGRWDLPPSPLGSSPATWR